MSAYPAAVAAGWFPVAAAGELGRRPLARMLMDTPLVVFRGEDGPAVLLDSCPHRNVPLSGGRVHGGLIECPYHGWRFGGDGRCALTPGAAMPAALRAKALAVVERAGLIWTTLAASAFPALPPQLDDAACDGFWWRIAPARARLADAVENLLDPAHPHFLHPGIVRSAKIRRPVQVTLRTAPGMAEAIYVENARAEALMPRLLEGMRTTGIGRFMPPATAQLIFEGPDFVRFALTVFFTPETATTVRSFAHFSTPRRRAPAFIKRALLLALHFPVLQQDRAMLRRQVEATERRGRMNYGLGPLDFLRPAIEALMAGEALDVSMTEAVIAL